MTGCTRKAVAACWLLGTLLLVPGRIAVAADSSVESARAHYERGVELANQGEYRLARDEFKAAYAASPHYATLYNIAQAEIALGRARSATEALTRYLRDGGDQISAKRRDQVVHQIALLESTFASLAIELEPPGASVQIDGAEIGPTPLTAPLRLAPGTHVVTASHPGREPASRVVKLDEGQTLQVTLSLQEEAAPRVVSSQSASPAATGAAPAPATDRWSRRSFALAGASVLLAGVTGALYLWNRDRYDEYRQSMTVLQTDSSPGRHQRVVENNALADSIETTNVLTVSCGIAAGALALGAAASFFLDFQSRSTPAQSGHDSAHLGLDLSLGRALLIWGRSW